MATKKQIEDEIAEYKALIADSSVPADEKDFAKEEIADLEKQLAALEKKAPAKEPKPAKAPKAKKVKKEKKKKKQSPVTTYQYKGKNIKDLTDSECAEMKKEVAARRAKAKASEKKSKSKPVIEKITGNVATAVKQAINNESAEEIKKNPKKFIERAEKIEKAAVSFLTEMKSILGDDFDKEAIEDEFADIHKLIKDLKTKYPVKAENGSKVSDRKVIAKKVDALVKKTFGKTDYAFLKGLAYRGAAPEKNGFSVALENNYNYDITTFFEYDKSGKLTNSTITHDIKDWTYSLDNIEEVVGFEGQKAIFTKFANQLGKLIAKENI